MKSTTIGIREAKAQLSRLVSEAERGAEWIITVRGRHVAKLTAVRDLRSPLQQRCVASKVGAGSNRRERALHGSLRPGGSEVTRSEHCKTTVAVEAIAPFAWLGRPRILPILISDAHGRGEPQWRVER